MKKLLIAAAALVTLAAPALAADMAPAPVYTKAPVIVAPVYSWTGFYIGGDVGWAGSRQNGSVTALPAGFGPPAIGGGGLAGFGILPTAHNLGGDGVLGGLYAGYNWQTGNAVYGFEGDVSFLNRRTSNTQGLFDTFTGVPTVDGSTVQITANTRSLESIRGRIGYAWNSFMLYGTGGVAFNQTNYALNLVTTPGSFNGAPSGSIGFSQNNVGYAVGFGAEWMATQNWIFRLEYLHYGFNGSSGTLPVVGDTCTVAVGCRLVASTSNLNIDSVRVGLAYKFGGPVVAKY
jgi:outer membrane immunogenic protein